MSDKKTDNSKGGGINMDVVWGVAGGAGIGGLVGAMGGSKASVAAGVVGGAALGGLIGYAISGAYWGLSHLKLPNPFEGLENALSGLGKAWNNALKGIEGIPGDIAKKIEGAGAAVGQAVAAATSPVPYPGQNYTMAAAQPGSGGVGAVSPAVSPIHGSEVAVPRVVGLERGGSIKGTPLFPSVQPYQPTPAQAQEMNQLATNPNATPAQWEAAGAQVETENVNGVPITWVLMPGSTGNFKSLKGYTPNTYNGGI